MYWFSKSSRKYIRCLSRVPWYSSHTEWQGHSKFSVWVYRIHYILLFRHNTPNPICCVATMCHQVRSMHWESLLCSQVSFKLIKNGLHERFIIQIYLDKSYEHAFYVCAIRDTQVRPVKSYCGFNTELHCSDFCGYQWCPQTLAAICRNMGICGSFGAAATWEKYQGLSYHQTIHKHCFTYCQYIEFLFTICD